MPGRVVQQGPWAFHTYGVSAGRVVRHNMYGSITSAQLSTFHGFIQSTWMCAGTLHGALRYCTVSQPARPHSTAKSTTAATQPKPHTHYDGEAALKVQPEVEVPEGREQQAKDRQDVSYNERCSAAARHSGTATKLYALEAALTSDRCSGVRVPLPT